MNIKIQQKNKGFTLVETLIAISIFTVSILSLLVVLSQGVASTNYAKQKIIASYLAQEGIEYMRNLRDTYVLFDATSPQTGWDSFNTKLTNANCDQAAGCYFDSSNVDYANNAQPMTNITLTPCSGGTCPNILFDDTNGKYGYVSGNTSGFIRQINVTQVADQTKVYSKVYWVQGSGTYSIVLSESLFNWVE